MTRVAFVVPYALPTSLRFLRAAIALPGVQVGVVAAEPLERLGEGLARRVSGHWRVEDPFDPGQLVDAVRGLERQMGAPTRLLGVLEQLQLPLALARRELGLPGLGPEAARRFRDKALMKDALRAAGVPCARHCLARSPAEVRAFVDEVGYPVILKPRAGAGAQGTHRLEGPGDLAVALAAFRPGRDSPLMLEEFVCGEERSFDSVCVNGELLWWSVSHYHPSPLEVLRNDWIQWAVVLPRRLDGGAHHAIREAGARALKALGLGTGMSHLEWFERPSGGVAVSEVAARPPGAQITTLMSYACDADLYAAWARLMVEERFDPPQRHYAAGAVYLRGQGSGDRVAGIRGLERAQAEVGELVVEARLPRPGQRRVGGYEGDGYVIVRHPSTEAVEEAIRTIHRRVRVELQ
ncbi:MAG: ATP-grasp domain-containing protein [Planctomycetota bacterium]|nr:MAG: ATP-grasp domain-containing protein [Planctomycetota bacterium]